MLLVALLLRIEMVTPLSIAMSIPKTARQKFMGFVEKAINFVLDKFGIGKRKYTKRNKYLSKINTNGMSFGDFFVALFQGVAGAVAS
jgi:hypothetical protein